MISKYTKEDLANAKFAEHPDGRIAMRSESGEQWIVQIRGNGSCVSRDDFHMASFGWVPVPSKRTISRSRFIDIAGEAYRRGDFDAEELVRLLGITIVPDPDPTNAEKIEAILADLDGAGFMTDPVLLSRHLDEHGVKAPGGDDDH